MSNITKALSFLLFYFVQGIAMATNQSIVITSNRDGSYNYHYTHTYHAPQDRVASIVDNNNAISQDP